MEDARTVIVRDSAELSLLSTRRKFLQALGLGGTIVLLPAVFAACDDNNNVTGPATTAAQTISLATDTGIFNFALVLEQLESTFYTQVVTNFSTLFTASEQELFSDLRNDEVVHREFLRAVLGSNAIPTLTFNFGSVAANKAAILQTSLVFETNGVAAYNGAGIAIKDANNLLLAGKIASVEARHASAIADAIDIASGSPTGKAYADLTTALATSLGANPTAALDCAAPAATVAKNAQSFIQNPITLA